MTYLLTDWKLRDSEGNSTCSTAPKDNIKERTYMKAFQNHCLIGLSAIEEQTPEVHSLNISLGKARTMSLLLCLSQDPQNLAQSLVTGKRWTRYPEKPSWLQSNSTTSTIFENIFEVHDWTGIFEVHDWTGLAK
ncbi:uncharacterized protein LOC144310421 [Canis aureus]